MIIVPECLGRFVEEEIEGVADLRFVPPSDRLPALRWADRVYRVEPHEGQAQQVTQRLLDLQDSGLVRVLTETNQ